MSSPLDPKEVVRFIKENPKLDKKQIGEFISNKKYSAVLEEYQKYVTLCLNNEYFVFIFFDSKFPLKILCKLFMFTIFMFATANMITLLAERG